MRVLVTGAAGFIGSAVARTLSAAGHEVIGLDAFLPEAHGEIDLRGRSSVDGVRRADVRDPDDVVGLLDGIDVVCHQAAFVGAGTTTSDLPLYAGHNDLGTAVLLTAMSQGGIDKLVLASSMVVYGYGRYRCSRHDEQPATNRSLDALRAGHFEVGCPICGTPMDWAPVDEEAALAPRSSYAASKVAQEHYALAWARQLPGSVVALRYHNVYGPGMPRDTPYSGVAAMFRSSLERGEPPRVFEDGGQVRDFVHVYDVALANLRAIERLAEVRPDTFEAFNICSGRPIRILEVAQAIMSGTERTGLGPRVTGEFRTGDVRHVLASPERARKVLGFTAQVSPEDGLRAFATAPLRS